MGRPTVYPGKQSHSLSIIPKALEELEAASDRTGWSVSDCITHLALTRAGDLQRGVQPVSVED